jgi:hypothetical protein
MKINLEQNLKQINGTNLVDEKNKLLDLKTILIKAALTDIKENDDSNKVSDFNIAMKIEKADKEVELGNSELTRLQKKVLSLYATLVVGQVNEILEGKKNPLEK